MICLPKKSRFPCGSDLVLKTVSLLKDAARILRTALSHNCGALTKKLYTTIEANTNDKTMKQAYNL